ncbi:transcriptional adapter 3 [Trichonephila clavipes]|nr:transcriptional adapter 3 [Trichonephila clavipes]
MRLNENYTFEGAADRCGQDLASFRCVSVFRMSRYGVPKSFRWGRKAGKSHALSTVKSNNVNSKHNILLCEMKISFPMEKIVSTLGSKKVQHSSEELTVEPIPRSVTLVSKRGLLEPEEEEESKIEEDEICQELKKLQDALKPVQEYNTIQKKKLLVLAKAEMAEQEAKKKLQEHDAKVMEIYRAVAAARRNKTMNKELEDQMKRTLTERQKLVEKLSKIQ